MIIRTSVVSALAMALLAGCASEPPPYRDPSEARGRVVDFTTYDFQQSANRLVDDLLSDPELPMKMVNAFGADVVPIVALRYENLTYQHDATDKLKEVMLDTIATRLLKSGRFGIVDRRLENIIGRDWEDEMNGVSVADGASAPLKNARGADYILHAALTEFREGDKCVHDVYYKMTARLVNKKTKDLDWIGEKEIRKVSKRSVVGW